MLNVPRPKSRTAQEKFACKEEKRKEGQGWVQIVKNYSFFFLFFPPSPLFPQKRSGVGRGGEKGGKGGLPYSWDKRIHSWGWGRRTEFFLFFPFRPFICEIFGMPSHKINSPFFSQTVVVLLLYKRKPFLPAFFAVVGGKGIGLRTIYL